MLTETLLDVKVTSSGDPKDSPFSRVMKYDGSLWDWYKDVNQERSAVFNRAMIGFGSMLDYDIRLGGMFRAVLQSSGRN